MKQHSGGADSAGGGSTLPTGNATGGVRNPVCAAGQSTGEVQAPVFRMKLNGQTSWFASPVLADLDGDGKNELIAAYCSVYVFNSQGQLLDRVDHNGGRIYAPHVVVDLEGDGQLEIFVQTFDHGMDVFRCPARPPTACPGRQPAAAPCAWGNPTTAVCKAGC
jgi:hypothetical protein